MNIQLPISTLDIGYSLFNRLTRWAAKLAAFFYGKKNAGNLCNIEKDPAIR